eukprot:1138618-Rhodomonas_salina.1
MASAYVGGQRSSPDTHSTPPRPMLADCASTVLCGIVYANTGHCTGRGLAHVNTILCGIAYVCTGHRIGQYEGLVPQPAAEPPLHSARCACSPPAPRPLSGGATDGSTAAAVAAAACVCPRPRQRPKSLQDYRCVGVSVFLS